jgi:hypothetical protein
MSAIEHEMDLNSLQRAMKVLSDAWKVPSVLIIDRDGATLNTDVSLHDNRKIAKAINDAFEHYYEEGKI